MAAARGIGVVGCGAISPTYVKALRAQPAVRLVGVADRDPAAASALARRHGLRQFPDPDALLASDEVEIVLNLTPPAAHASVSEAALREGKHIYTEKPFAASFGEGEAVAELGSARKLRVGAAPDTFLGAGWQTARRLLDEGAIGEPVAAEASFLCPGHEAWHPRPQFYYTRGGGPLLDMGPYYLTGLISLLGPIARVTGTARISRPERRPARGPHAGASFPVEVATHVVGTLEFASGAIASLTTSFDAWTPQSTRAVVYGSEGTMDIPDPNGFGGRLRLWPASEGRWRTVPLDDQGGWLQGRGLGLLEMCAAMSDQRPHRASGELGLHVLEAMEAIMRSAESGERQALATTCRRPAALVAAT
jgi:predicted dehydrogenase